MIKRTTVALSVVSVVTVFCLIFIACEAGAAPGVLIHGYVFDQDHQTVANASVVLLDGEVPLPTSSNPAMTDTNGYYAFWGIVQGQYCLVASKGAHSYSNTILVRERDVLQNFTFQATSAELTATLQPTASPVPTPVPSATAEPAKSVTPVPQVSPGFGLLLLLPGVLTAAVLIMFLRKRQA